jgi:hypothetical protein
MMKNLILASAISFLLILPCLSEAANTSKIKQEGNDNRAAILQATINSTDDNNYGEIVQAGKGNVGKIIQNTSSAEAYIKQVVTGSATLQFGNFAVIQQQSSQGSIATIHQTADNSPNNEAEIQQKDRFNEATIKQTGHHLTAKIVQGDLSGQDNIVSIEQIGFWNRLGANGGGGNDSFTQDGDGNTANFIQVAQISDIEGFQNGNGNEVDITQGQKGNDRRRNSIPEIRCLNCFASISQTGNLNTATIIQQGLNGYSGVDLEAIITQNGWENVASIEQYGTDNFAEITLTGNYNEASILQDGNDNFADVSYTGNNNQFSLEQHGDGNSFTIDIVGDGNTAFLGVVQNGGVTFP